MADIFGGDNAPLRQPGDPTNIAPTGYMRAPLMVLHQDHKQVPNGTVNGTKVYLADIALGAILDPDMSKIHFDDAGAAQTLDIGDANSANALVAALDIHTAAGSSSLLAAIDRANYGKRLWQLLGYATLQAAKDAASLAGHPGKARLYATIGGADIGADTDLFWRFVGVDG